MQLLKTDILDMIDAEIQWSTENYDIFKDLSNGYKKGYLAGLQAIKCMVIKMDGRKKDATSKN
jgi:hypothetical protein